MSKYNNFFSQIHWEWWKVHFSNRGELPPPHFLILNFLLIYTSGVSKYNNFFSEIQWEWWKVNFFNRGELSPSPYFLKFHYLKISQVCDPIFRRNFHPTSIGTRRFYRLNHLIKTTSYSVFFKNLKFLSFAQKSIFDFKIKNHTKMLTNICRKQDIRFGLKLVI